MSPENSANRHLVLRADVAETNKTEGEQVTFFLCSEGFKKDKQKYVSYGGPNLFIYVLLMFLSRVFRPLLKTSFFRKM